jgi:hypothetical protein
LSDGLTALAGDFEHMGGAVTEFQALVAEAQEAVTQQAILTSAKQEATQRAHALLKTALEQGAFLRKAARVRYGRRSDKLAQLGVQPFRGRKTPVATAAPAPDPDPETPAAVEIHA